jgi:hypothetical protein
VRLKRVHVVLPISFPMNDQPHWPAVPVRRSICRSRNSAPPALPTNSVSIDGLHILLMSMVSARRDGTAARKFRQGFGKAVRRLRRCEFVLSPSRRLLLKFSLALAPGHGLQLCIACRYMVPTDGPLGWPVLHRGPSIMPASATLRSQRLLPVSVNPRQVGM